jgi:hypothetical protein
LRMLAVTSYQKDYVEARRAEVEGLLARYRDLAAAAKGKPAVEAFSAPFFNAMVLALDHSFMHRLRNAELKDGNPLNEVRMLANSILEHGGVLQADKTIKYDASKSVTGSKIGEKIVIGEAVFAKLATAFLDEIEKKYP